MKIRTKHHVTLLETMIAMSLLAVLLTMVFGFFKELNVLSSEIENEEKKAFKARLIESRLQNIFSQIVNENESAKTFFFYTQPPDDSSAFTQLILSFDNGVRRQPLLSGEVLGHLFLDHEERLVLTIWPIDRKNLEGIYQKEVLLEGVKEIRFRFYAPPPPKADFKASSGADPQKTTAPVDQWIEDEWLESYKEMPVIIEIFLTLSDEDQILKMAFVLPSSKHPLQLL